VLWLTLVQSCQKCTKLRRSRTTWLYSTMVIVSGCLGTTSPRHTVPSTSPGFRSILKDVPLYWNRGLWVQTSSTLRCRFTQELLWNISRRTSGAYHVRIVQLLIIFYLICFKLQLIFNGNSIVNRNWYWRRHLGFSDSGFANLWLNFQVVD